VRRPDSVGRGRDPGSAGQVERLRPGAIVTDAPWSPSAPRGIFVPAEPSRRDCDDRGQVMNEPKAIEPAPPRGTSPRISSRTGWLAFRVGIAAQLLVTGLVAVYVAANTPDPSDESWGWLALLGGMLFAPVAAVLTSILLAVLAGSQGRACPPTADPGRAFLVGIIGGPLVSIGLLFACASLLEEARSVPLDVFVAVVLPTLLGIGLTLLGYPAWRLRPLPSPPGPGPRGVRTTDTRANVLAGRSDLVPAPRPRTRFPSLIGYVEARVRESGGRTARRAVLATALGSLIIAVTLAWAGGQGVLFRPIALLGPLLLGVLTGVAIPGVAGWTFAMVGSALGGAVVGMGLWLVNAIGRVNDGSGGSGDPLDAVASVALMALVAPVLMGVQITIGVIIGSGLAEVRARLG
jgi:MFS family permease